jgi:hypothetical protein
LSALGVIPGDGIEVRRENIYEQGESRKGGEVRKQTDVVTTRLVVGDL